MDRGFLSRKFLVTCGTLVIATVLLILKVVEPSHWVEVVKYVLIAYLSGKVLELGVKEISRKGNPESGEGKIVK